MQKTFCDACHAEIKPSDRKGTLMFPDKTKGNLVILDLCGTCCDIAEKSIILKP